MLMKNLTLMSTILRFQQFIIVLKNSILKFLLHIAQIYFNLKCLTKTWKENLLISQFQVKNLFQSNFKISLVPLYRAQKLPDEKRSQCQNTITRTVISWEQPFVLKNGWVVILLLFYMNVHSNFFSDNDIYVLSTLSKAP